MGISYDSRDEAHGRIHHDQGWQFASSHDIIPKRNFFNGKAGADSFINTLVMSAKKDQGIGFLAQFLSEALGKSKLACILSKTRKPSWRA